MIDFLYFINYNLNPLGFVVVAVVVANRIIRLNITYLNKKRHFGRYAFSDPNFSTFLISN